MHLEVSTKIDKKQPLYFVTGSSGSGKTYVINELRTILPEKNWVSLYVNNLY